MDVEKAYRNFEQLHLERLLGSQIETNLLTLAAIGGTEIPGSLELPRRFSVNRVALSETDFQAREHLETQMKEAGMGTVIKHPLGLIGFYEGSDPSLAPVVMESHFDSVPTAGMYDGTVGTVSAIEVIKHFNENGIKPKRSIIVTALTGEESSGFNMALFGSRGIALGLTDSELNQGRPDGPTIKKALEERGFQASDVQKPFFEKGSLHAVVELHVSQDDRLNKSGHDLAVIKDIAAPRRFQITVGDKLESSKEPKFANNSYFSVDVHGKVGHSGATPMGDEYRADGFVVMSDILTFSKKIQERVKEELKQDIEISIGDLGIEGQAMNKIPGLVSSKIRISASSLEAVEFANNLLEQFAKLRNTDYARKTAFGGNEPIRIQQIDQPEVADQYYDSEKILERHFRVGEIVKFINFISNKKEYKEAKNVGTVGTYKFDKGQIVLGVDIRGVNKDSRDEMIMKIMTGLDILKGKGELAYKELAGSGDPVAMDPRLVELAEKTIQDNEIGTYVTDFSPAGHDAQNFARAGHPTVMLFIPSRNGGIAHTPEEYSTTKDLENGARALASLVYNLAMEQG